MKAILNEGKAVYVYFNNTIGDAVKNLQTLNNFCYHDRLPAKPIM
jgi:uncharacterized protein YecE (DUF72 family)